MQDFIRQKNRKGRTKQGQLDRTADKGNCFLKGGSRIWSYDLYVKTQVPNEAVPTYCKNNLPVSYKEAFLKSWNQRKGRSQNKDN